MKTITTILLITATLFTGCKKKEIQPQIQERVINTSVNKTIDMSVTMNYSVYDNTIHCSIEVWDTILSPTQYLYKLDIVPGATSANLLSKFPLGKGQMLLMDIYDLPTNTTFNIKCLVDGETKFNYVNLTNTDLDHIAFNNTKYFRLSYIND